MKNLNKQKIAIISGITGQDGSYLAEILLKKGYKVIGLKRRTSLICTDRIDHLFNNPNLKLEYWNLLDANSTWKLINKYKPDEFYNLAALSHVRVSFDNPEETMNGILLGTLRVLEAIRELSPHTKFYQASTSEIYGNAECPKTGYTEESKMNPVSPYAIAKHAAYQLVKTYRESYNIFTCNGILFNHESKRRGETFVSRKITLAAAKIAHNRQNSIELGNLDAYRDWGHAKDYMEMAYKMLQQNEPDDYVVATGQTRTIRDMLNFVFDYANLGDYTNYVKINPKYFRPNEVPYLLGNSLKAQTKLSWKPKISFEEMLKEMYNNDYQKVLKEVKNETI